VSHDLFSKPPGSRNWARGIVSRERQAVPADAIVHGSLPAPVKKIARGAMVLGTLAGLAFITSPWWRPLPGRTSLSRDPMRRRVYLSPRTPANNIMWSRR
jgi:hypothetical protein